MNQHLQPPIDSPLAAANLSQIERYRSMSGVRPFVAALVLATVFGSACAAEDQPVPGSNPIIRDVFTADAAPLVVGETVYLYVGHDNAKGREMFTMPEWLCYSSNDMTPRARRPWEDIDPTVWIDDGTPWMSWGNGDCYLVNLIQHDRARWTNREDRPATLRGGSKALRTRQALLPRLCRDRAASRFRAGRLRDCGIDHRPMDPPRDHYRPAKNSFTIYPGVIEFRGQWYFFYHYAGLTLNGEKGPGAVPYAWNTSTTTPTARSNPLPTPKKV